MRSATTSTTRRIAPVRRKPEGALCDPLDEVNSYLVAKAPRVHCGFVAVTPPSPRGYSTIRYFDRGELPLAFDAGLYEVRLLTVPSRHRQSAISGLLMYAAFRFGGITGGATPLWRSVASSLLDLYTRVGLHPLGKRATSGRGDL